jgi:hypothetical protein
MEPNIQGIGFVFHNFDILLYPSTKGRYGKWWIVLVNFDHSTVHLEKLGASV